MSDANNFFCICAYFCVFIHFALSIVSSFQGGLYPMEFNLVFYEYLCLILIYFYILWFCNQNEDNGPTLKMCNFTVF